MVAHDVLSLQFVAGCDGIHQTLVKFQRAVILLRGFSIGVFVQTHVCSDGVHDVDELDVEFIVGGGGALEVEQVVLFQYMSL